MDWQQMVSLMVVAVAGISLAWSKLRRRRFSLQRDTPCGCAGAGREASASSIVFHARKGERPEVRVRMRP
ncbi:MAG TPA: hypothetical protein VN829_10155 [Dongiaceae bacterium]|nr:hypothetical protein [Dongiaceae bacterium]